MRAMTRSPGMDTRTARTVARTAAPTLERRPAHVHACCCLFCFLASLRAGTGATAPAHGATR
jgi:hypothetical protein